MWLHSSSRKFGSCYQNQPEQVCVHTSSSSCCTHLVLFPQLWCFSHPATLCSENRTTNNSFYLTFFGLVHCSLGLPLQFASQNEGAGEIFLSQRISVSSGTVHFTSMTSLWMVRVTPTIKNKSRSIKALPVVPIWNFSCGNKRYPGVLMRWLRIFVLQQIGWFQWLQHACVQSVRAHTHTHTYTENMFLLLYKFYIDFIM